MTHDRMLDGHEAAAGEPSSTTAQPAPAALSPHELLTSRSYLRALILGAAVGVPVAMVAYLFLLWIDQAQQYVFTSLPGDVGFRAVLLGLPLTSVLLTAVFLSADAVASTPLVIVSVVVAYVADARLAFHPFGRMSTPR